MNDENVIVSADTIKASPLGEELTDDECAKLVQAITPIGLIQNAFLLEEGHTSDAIYVVTKGTLEVVTQAGENDYVTLQLLKEGDMTGELGFIDDRPHSAGIRALTNAELFSLGRDQLETFLYTEPDLVYKIMRAIIRTVHGILYRMNSQYIQMTNYITHQHGRY